MNRKERTPKRKLVERLLVSGIAAGLFLASYVPQVVPLFNTEPKPVAAAPGPQEPDTTPTLNIFTPSPTPGEGTVYPTATPTPDPCEISAASPSDAEIVCGNDADEHEWPATVKIEGCGGSLLDSNWVLTAAHCTVFLIQNEEVLITFGDHEAAEGDEIATRTFFPKDALVHPDFDPRTFTHDYALIRLVPPVSLIPGVIETIDIVSPEDAEIAASTGTTVTVVGWGATSENGTFPEVLQEVELPIADWQVCKSNYDELADLKDWDYRIDPTMICAGYPQGVKDACGGDSGGPMMWYNIETQTFEQLGIVSWGEGCARPGYYGVYSNLLKVSNWIDSRGGTVEVPRIYIPLVYRN